MAVIGYVLKLHNSLLGINMIYHHISCGKRKYIPQKSMSIFGILL